MRTFSSGAKKGTTPFVENRIPSVRHEETEVNIEDLNRHQRRAVAKQRRKGVRRQFT